MANDNNPFKTIEEKSKNKKRKTTKREPKNQNTKAPIE